MTKIVLAVVAGAHLLQLAQGKLGGFASLVDSQAPFAWVPADSCKAPLKLCYEGTQDRLSSVKNIDILNLCREQSTVLKGSCADHGYGELIGKDPLFQDLTLYRKSKGALSHGQEKVSVLEVAMEMLAQEDEGLCWRHLHTRHGHIGKSCNEDEEEQFDFCWQKCPAGSEGMGPLCMQSCSAPYGISYGPLCCDTEDNCKKFSTSEASKIMLDIGKAVMDRENPAKLIMDLRKLYEDAKGLDLQTCP